MAKNEYVFENTIREPSKGITVNFPWNTRTIGEGEVHLKYSPGSCKFPGASGYTGGHCLLTEKYLYFVGNARREDRQYLEIPVATIQRLVKHGLGWYLTVYVDTFVAYDFCVNGIQDWMDSIAKLKQEQSHSQPETVSPVSIPNAPTKRFCSYCGAKLEGANVYCPECGNVI